MRAERGIIMIHQHMCTFSSKVVQGIFPETPETAICLVIQELEGERLSALTVSSQSQSLLKEHKNMVLSPSPEKGTPMDHIQPVVMTYNMSDSALKPLCGCLCPTE